jgi:hypothetical protein
MAIIHTLYIKQYMPNMGVYGTSNRNVIILGERETNISMLSKLIPNTVSPPKIFGQ